MYIEVCPKGVSHILSIGRDKSKIVIRIPIAIGTKRVYSYLNASTGSNLEAF